MVFQSELYKTINRLQTFCFVFECHLNHGHLRNPAQDFNLICENTHEPRGIGDLSAIALTRQTAFLQSLE